MSSKTDRCSIQGVGRISRPEGEGAQEHNPEQNYMGTGAEEAGGRTPAETGSGHTGLGGVTESFWGQKQQKHQRARSSKGGDPRKYMVTTQA